MLEAQGSFHARNLSEYPTLAGGEIVLGTSPTDTGGPSIAEHHGTNIEGNERQRIQHVGAITAPHDFEKAYANYVITSGAGGSHDVPGGALQVLAGQGNLTVRRYDTQ